MRHSVWRFLLSISTYPLILGGGMTAGVLARQAGHGAASILVVTSIASILLVAVLERAHPYIRSWNHSRRDVVTDALHALFSNVAVIQIVDLVVLAGLATAAPRLSSAIGSTLWPSSLPLAAQFGIALVVAELGVYLAHRMLHHVPPLWRVHAVHHSAERLYWLNANRNHPLDVLFQYTSLTAPLVVLGAGSEVLLLVMLFSALHTPLQHSNIDVRSGPLSFLISTSELHRWHHARGDTGNVNFGTNLILWDQLFRTFHRPGSACRDVGLESADDFPTGFLAQLQVPFRRRRASSSQGPR